MTRPIAVAGDTQVATSSSKHDADKNGTGQWTLISSTVTQGDKVSVSGKKVELRATASWSYVGGTVGSSPPSPVGPFSDSATLTPPTTRLKDKGRDVLVDGDKATGSVDSSNKIEVSASQDKLRTD